MPGIDEDILRELMHRCTEDLHAPSAVSDGIVSVAGDPAMRPAVAQPAGEEEPVDPKDPTKSQTEQFEVDVPVVNPGGTPWRRTKLRIRSPAPISSISESASSETTSRPRNRRRARWPGAC